MNVVWILIALVVAIGLFLLMAAGGDTEQDYSARRDRAEAVQEQERARRAAWEASSRVWRDLTVAAQAAMASFTAFVHDLAEKTRIPSQVLIERESSLEERMK